MYHLFDEFFSDQLRRILKLPTSVAIEYKRHQESITDNSSYRNPSVVWRAAPNDPAATQPPRGFRSNQPGATRPIQNKEGGKSRWDALAPKTEGGSADQTGKPKWRNPNNTQHGNWHDQKNSWGREKSNDSNDGAETHSLQHPAPVNTTDSTGPTTPPAATESASGSSFLKGKNIGGWVKNQLAKEQSEAKSTTE